MKQIIIFILSFCAAIQLSAQSDTVYVETDTTIVEFPTEQAQFPGGIAGWTNHITRHLNHSLAETCLKIPKGKRSVQQTVLVGFKVDKEGGISDVKVLNAAKVHPLLAEESMRVVREGPKWIPGSYNGRKVNSYKSQPIIWMLSE